MLVPAFAKTNTHTHTQTTTKPNKCHLKDEQALGRLSTQEKYLQTIADLYVSILGGKHF